MRKDSIRARYLVMQPIALTLVFSMFFVLGCGSNGHSGKRNSAKDSHCTRSQKIAYDFENLDDARKAGCTQVRIHMGKKDPKTGKTHDFEDIVWCCTK